MKNKKHTISMARRLAPEDVKPDMFVALHEVICEHATYFLYPDALKPVEQQKMRIVWQADGAGKPYRVKAVCLPYVLALEPEGNPRTFDLRKHNLVRLDDAYGRQAFHAIKSSGSKRKGSKGGKDDDDDDDDDD